MPLVDPVSVGVGGPHRIVTETDADRIQREKDRRRAEERIRIDREHHRRLHEVESLRRGGGHSTAEEDQLPAALPPKVRASAEPPRPTEPPVAAPSVVQDRTGSSPSSGERREVGRPIQSDPLRAFLALDPAEGFDILDLNSVSVSHLLQEPIDDPDLLARVAERTEALMERVKREVDDPLSAGALLREFALRWYRDSPEQASWERDTPDRWGGVFAESRVSGGRLHPWLNVRLRSLYQHAVRRGALGRRVRQGLTRGRPADTAVSRSATQQIQAEVAQAFLDDLANHARRPEAPLPLVKLSELAVRRQVATVTDALAALFSSSESGPFVVLHPNRYPDCEEVHIRPPMPSASGAALAFTLQTPKSGRKPTGRSGGPAALADGSEAPVAVEGIPDSASVDPAMIWESPAASTTAWRAVLDEARRERHRLDAPPREYRSRPSYGSLRELLLHDAEARKAFLAVRWRGRPAGLPLLVALLQKGQIAPEVATDHEYLEAELADLAEGDSPAPQTEGAWAFPGWTVTREGSHRDGLKYRATQTGGAGTG